MTENCPIVEVNMLDNFAAYSSINYKTGDIVRYQQELGNVYGLVKQTILINNIPCLKIIILNDNGNLNNMRECYLKEQCAELIKQVKDETKYIEDFIILPHSIVVIKTEINEEWRLNQNVRAKSTESNLYYEGVILWSGTINTINAVAIHLTSSDDKIQTALTDGIINEEKLFENTKNAAFFTVSNLWKTRSIKLASNNSIYQETTPDAFILRRSPDIAVRNSIYQEYTPIETRKSITPTTPKKFPKPFRSSLYQSSTLPRNFSNQNSEFNSKTVNFLSIQNKKNLDYPVNRNTKEMANINDTNSFLANTKAKENNVNQKNELNDDEMIAKKSVSHENLKKDLDGELNNKNTLTLDFEDSRNNNTNEIDKVSDNNNILPNTLTNENIVKQNENESPKISKVFANQNLQFKAELSNYISVKNQTNKNPLINKNVGEIININQSKNIPTYSKNNDTNVNQDDEVDIQIFSEGEKEFPLESNYVVVSETSNSYDILNLEKVKYQGDHQNDGHMKYCERNKISVIDPFTISSILDGQSINKIIKFKFENEAKILNIKWKGLINGSMCFGCYMTYGSEYGTNGVFACQELFQCPDRHGVLIPINKLSRSCLLTTHMVIKKISKLISDFHLININNVCCFETLEKLSKWPKLGINGKLLCHRSFHKNVVGQCKWLGLINGEEAVGLEMSENVYLGTNGSFDYFNLFECQEGRGVLILASDILKEIYYQSKEIPESLNKSKEITIRSIVKYTGYKENKDNMIGTVCWMGVNENEEYFYGLVLNNKIPGGTDGTFKNQKLFSCQNGFGILSPIRLVTLQSNYEESEEIKMLKHFAQKIEFSADIDVSNQLIAEGLSMKNIEIIKMIIANSRSPIILKNHPNLLTELMAEKNYDVIATLLNNCEVTQKNDPDLLLLAYICITCNDDQLANLAISKCTNRNSFLTNGETLITNLIKNNVKEEKINEIIKSNLFHSTQINKYNQNPLILASGNVMVSTVKIILETNPDLSSDGNLALKNVLLAKERIKELECSMEDILQIIEMLSSQMSKETNICTICSDKKINRVFNCGHNSCNTCADEMFDCPFCRLPIIDKKQLFLE